MPAAVSAIHCDHLEELTRDECMLRLRAHGVGRIGARLRGRPVVYPVNYVVHDGAILFRTRPGGDLDVATRGEWAAFEIDGADHLYHEGWSVLVVGAASHITDADELAHLTTLCLSPWADEGRNLFVRIPLDDVSGRRIHHRAPSDVADADHSKDPEFEVTMAEPYDRSAPSSV